MEKYNLDEITFEGRNKDYGAYYLRTHYAAYLQRAFLGASAGFLGFVFSAFVYFYFKKPVDLSQIPDGVIEITNKIFTEKKEELKPKKLEKPQQASSAPKKTLQNLPPVAIDDAKKETDVRHTAEELFSTPTGPDEIHGPAVDPSLIELPAADSKKEELIAAPAPLEDNSIKDFVQEMPEYYGGQKAMLKYLQSQIIYPASAVRVNVSGKVYVRFVIEKDGSVNQVSVLRGVGFGCDEEAQRVVKSMPKWKPGVQNGQNVRVWMNIPIVFSLE
jgi:periplasmic protein TonB